MKTVNAINKLLDVPVTDPDDARRRKLLNILLIGTLILTLLGEAAFAALVFATDLYDQEPVLVTRSFFVSGALIIILLFIFVLNRYVAGWLAGSLFLTILIGLLPLSDEPAQVVEGRSTILLTFPIMVASIILPPYSSFITAGLASLATIAIALYIQYLPNPFALAMYFGIALVSWLGSRTLEQALRNLRILNRELETRVIEKTKLVKELEELDNRKSEFLSTVSHELRTPLTAIKGSVENVLSEMYGPITDKQRDRLRIALAGVNDETGLVENLLDLVRIQENRVSLDLEDEDLTYLIRSVVQILEYDAHKKNINLRMELSPANTLKARIDREKIKRVMTNLVNNAIKFTPEGGTITVSATDVGEWIEVRVEDTGIGIPTSEQERIFDRFYQVDTSLTREAGGAGIGLSIVKKYVEMHNGEIKVQSEPGKGSTFTIKLLKEL